MSGSQLKVLEGKQRRKLNRQVSSRQKCPGFFAGHYGFFHVIYLIFIVTVTRSFSKIATLSLALSITIFLFNHFFSYRYQLRKDLEGCPVILNMMFLPYARVVPMHLIVFIGLMMGKKGSSTELFLFLFLKTLVDLAMHLITQVNWKTDMDPGWAEHLKRAGEKSKKNTGKKMMCRTEEEPSNKG
ncbi:DUF6498-containing protein [Desulfopila sp. IMCC35008]|uniref:DUF6498-containing protein n=1 Tax=Desulfopila sp. IMCC35008 TaxID=2653858 RepID=UPI0013D4AF93|nr:DUF6498-containing protein [Desulfopila sp. IMCC35008]